VRIHVVVTKRFPQLDREGSDAGFMLSFDHRFLVDDCVATGLGRRPSGRRCLLCEQSIGLCDRLGLREGICGDCALPWYLVRDSPLRSPIRRLIAAFGIGQGLGGALPVADRVAHDVTAEEFRAA
jgi:hypothetical protein